MQRNPAYLPPPPESIFSRSLDAYFRPLQEALPPDEALAARKEWEPIGAALNTLEAERAAARWWDRRPRLTARTWADAPPGNQRAPPFQPSHGIRAAGSPFQTDGR